MSTLTRFTLKNEEYYTNILLLARNWQGNATINRSRTFFRAYRLGIEHFVHYWVSLLRFDI